MSILVEDQRGQVLLTVGSRDQQLFDIPEGMGYLDFLMDEVLLAGGTTS